MLMTDDLFVILTDNLLICAINYNNNDEYVRSHAVADVMFVLYIIDTSEFESPPLTPR